MAGYKLPAGEGKTPIFITIVLTVISILECMFFAFLWSITIGF